MKPSTVIKKPSDPARALRSRLGVCQWFHFEDYRQVERTVATLHELGIRHLRTGISWADYHRPGGQAWYDWQMRALEGLEVLVSVWHTPPSLAEGGTCNSPPKRLRDYADFIDLVINRYEGLFAALELWNEPNNRYKWDFASYDPDWSKLGRMVCDAAYWAKQRGQTTVLGGIIPVDRYWLDLMRRYGALDWIDVVAIHGFPGMWWADANNWDWYDHWHGWERKLNSIRPVAGSRPIWVTETGIATWDLSRGERSRDELQCQMLEEAAQAPAERVYWYCLYDLDPRREAIEGFHVDENEYHMGLITHDGQRKPAFFRLKQMLKSKSPAPA